MESTIRQNNSVKFELDVALTGAEVAPYLDAAYREAQKHASIKGFRPGRVPVSMIKKMYGPALEREAYEEAVQKEFAKAMNEQDIHPIGTPAITRLDNTEEGGLAFTVAYEVLPTVELKEYKGLPARKVFHVISDEELQAELDRIREGNVSGDGEPAESVADENHVVRADLRKMVDGVPDADGGMTDVPMHLGRADVNPELKASMMNRKVGDVFHIDLPTGEQGALINYEVTVKAIHHVVLPAIDDELAQRLLGRDDAVAADLVEAVRQSLAADYERRYAGYFRDELVNALIDRHDFEVPDAFVEEVLKSFIEDSKRGPKKELPKDFDLQRFVTEMRPTAERTAKWALLRDSLIEREQLTPDEADYEGLAELESQRTGIEFDMLMTYFKKSDKIRDRILAEKAMQLLEDYAIVEEIEDRTMPTRAHSHDHDHDHDHDHTHDHDHAHDHDGEGVHEHGEAAAEEKE